MWRELQNNPLKSLLQGSKIHICTNLKNKNQKRFLAKNVILDLMFKISIYIYVCTAETLQKVKYNKAVMCFILKYCLKHSGLKFLRNFKTRCFLPNTGRYDLNVSHNQFLYFYYDFSWNIVLCEQQVHIHYDIFELWI